MTTLVLGASGFVGSAVMRQFASRADASAIGFVRTAKDAGRLHDAGIRAAIGDLNDTSSLRRAMSQVDTVISCTSYVGSDVERCLEVNQHGMRNVSRVASELGIERLLYVSTAAVYGPGPFRDLPVGAAPLQPRSPASRTRVGAERHVHEAGGLVVRPHLIYGPGDKWFWPGLRTVTDRLGCIIDDGSALHSTIHVDHLAEVIGGLSEKGSFCNGQTVHVNDPQPRPVIEILHQISRNTGWTVPEHTTTRESALVRAEELGIDAEVVNLISQDHWFR